VGRARQESTAPRCTEPTSAFALLFYSRNTPDIFYFEVCCPRTPHYCKVKADIGVMYTQIRDHTGKAPDPPRNHIGLTQHGEAFFGRQWVGPFPTRTKRYLQHRRPCSVVCESAWLLRQTSPHTCIEGAIASVKLQVSRFSKGRSCMSSIWMRTQLTPRKPGNPGNPGKPSFAPSMRSRPFRNSELVLKAADPFPSNLG
jgi:hypothetical protein